MSREWVNRLAGGIAALLVYGLGTPNLQAGPVVYTRVGDGSEPKTTWFFPTSEGLNTCNPATFGAYFDFGIFRVSTTETYTVFNAERTPYGTGLNIAVYSGDFVPSEHSRNRVALFHNSSEISLQSGTDYRIVVQHPCTYADQRVLSFKTYSFAVGIVPVATDSSGTAVGDGLKPLPGYMYGVFDGSEPSADFGYGNLWYQISVPFQVSKTGLYFLAQGFSGSRVIGIYEAPFNPDSPGDPRAHVPPHVFDYQFSDNHYLLAGRDYYVVVQPGSKNRVGRWLFTMAPAREFYTNNGMNGSWFNPEFDGQGFFVDVLENLIPSGETLASASGTLFLGWYAYDVKDPLNPDEATVGYSGSRWLTAVGPYKGASADLAIELTTGGRFHDPQTVSQDVDYGTIHLEFQDCENGMLTYDIPAAGMAGQMSIRRVAAGNEALCVSRLDGRPGELVTD